MQHSYILNTHTHIHTQDSVYTAETTAISFPKCIIGSAFMQ